MDPLISQSISSACVNSSAHELQRTMIGQRHAHSPDVVHTLDILPKHGQFSSSTLTVNGDFNFVERLRDLARQYDEEAIQPRELGVVFNDLRVIGIGATALQSTIGSFFNLSSLLRTISSIRNPPRRDILSGFAGVISPGEMLLVLGKPGSGCSTFLKTLANQRGEYHAVEGEVSYDPFTPEDIRKYYRGDVIYCPEDDIHFPTLTVEQTISFAIKTRTPHTRLANQSRKEFNREILDILLRVFGLHHVRKTVVGNARGVSSGEKKRVSIAEALSCRSVLAAWDNSTRGLDSSTALKFVQALRLGTDIARRTTIVSIYQVGEQLYHLFDKVCIIAEGKMVYFGSANAARQYFIDMGYEPHSRQTTADFLVAVTDPIGRKVRPGFEGIVPRTAEQMAAYFHASQLGHLNRRAIEDYRALHVGNTDHRVSYEQSVLKEHSRYVPKSSPYIISIPMQVKAVMVRRAQIIKGDLTAQVVQLFAQIYQSVVIGTIFLNLPDATSSYSPRGAILFFTILFSAVFCMTEIPTLFAHRPIILRHYKAAMYYPFIDALAHTVVDIPITFTIQVVFCSIIYFLVGFERTTYHFFIFFLVIFTMTIAMKSFIRLIAACFKAESGATSTAGVALLFIAVYSGFIIPLPSIPGGLKWIAYINPLHYGLGAIIMNEFHTLNSTCNTLVPQGPGYENISLVNQVCTTIGSLPGMDVVDGNRFVNLLYGYSYGDLWKNYSVICALGVSFFAMLFIATTYNTSSTFDTRVTLFKEGVRCIGSILTTTDEESPSPLGSNTLSAGRDIENTASEKPAFGDIFTWKNIQYAVPVSGGERRLLDNVSGYVAPGELTALMGESGAGKTTLLNVLAQRVDIGVITGETFVNGHPLPADFQAQVGYCQQTDTHLPQTTVREALLFSARLRQPESVPFAELESYVDKCLMMCGLENYADAIVGSLDVEHRKRTTIGVELAAKPKLLLFLDEPTSGLDSLSAWAIIMCLRELANNGQAILCTIHQPSAELFQVFDKLLLLRKDGQTVYFGDIGDKSSVMLNYFERNGAPHCDDNANPAEYVLDIIGAGATASTSVDWYDVWLKSPEAAAFQERIAQIHTNCRTQAAVDVKRHTIFATSWIDQAMVLTKRNFQAYWRNPTYLLSKIALNVTSGLLIGFSFFQTNDTLQGMENKLFAIFMAMLLCIPMSQQLQSVYIDIRTVYEVRECPSRMYTWTALVTSLILVEIPWNILSSSLCFICWYWAAGYSTSRAGYTYLLYGIVFPLYYTTTAQAVASMAPSAEIGSVIFGTLFSFVIFTNGVFQPYHSLGWWKWMYRVSPFTYFVEGLFGQAIGGTLVNCAPDELVPINPPHGFSCLGYMERFISIAGGYTITNGDAMAGCLYCPYRTGDQFMANVDMKYSHDWRNLGILLGICVFNVCAVYMLTYVFRVQRNGIFRRLRYRRML